MPRWPWIERTFHFDFPPAKLPDLLERLRGTPARLEERVAGLSAGVLTRRDGASWSIQENVGHLLDLGYLPRQRISEILSGQPVLIAADMSNRRTHEADHHARPIAELLAAFRAERRELVDRFESISEVDWSRAALHPRLQHPMRIVDIAYFDSEHDDYHLARIGELIHKFA